MSGHICNRRTNNNLSNRINAFHSECGGLRLLHTRYEPYIKGTGALRTGFNLNNHHGALVNLVTSCVTILMIHSHTSFTTSSNVSSNQQRSACRQIRSRITRCTSCFHSDTTSFSSALLSSANLFKHYRNMLENHTKVHQFFNIVQIFGNNRVFLT